MKKKVNAKSRLVESYIEDDLGFGSYTMMAYPIQIKTVFEVYLLDEE